MERLPGQLAAGPAEPRLLRRVEVLDQEPAPGLHPDPENGISRVVVELLVALLTLPQGQFGDSPLSHVQEQSIGAQVLPILPQERGGAQRDVALLSVRTKNGDLIAAGFAAPPLGRLPEDLLEVAFVHELPHGMSHQLAGLDTEDARCCRIGEGPVLLGIDDGEALAQLVQQVAEVGLALAEGFLGRLALGDVLEQRAGAQVFPGLAKPRADAQRDHPDLSVRSADLLLVVTLLAPSPGVRLALDLLERLRFKEVPQVASRQLPRNPENGRGGLVGEDNPLGGVREGKALVEPVQELPEMPLACLQRLLGILPFGDVLGQGDDDILAEVSAFVDADVLWEDLAIGPDAPEFEMLGFPGKGLLDESRHLFKIVDAGSRKHIRSLAQEELLGPAVHFNCAPVHIHEASLAIQNVDGLQDALEKAAIGGLGFLPRRDVPHDGLIGPVGQHLRVHLDGPQAAIPAEQIPFRDDPLSCFQ